MTLLPTTSRQTLGISVVQESLGGLMKAGKLAPVWYIDLEAYEKIIYTWS